MSFQKAKWRMAPPILSRLSVVAILQQLLSSFIYAVWGATTGFGGGWSLIWLTFYAEGYWMYWGRWPTYGIYKSAPVESNILAAAIIVAGYIVLYTRKED